MKSATNDFPNEFSDTTTSSLGKFDVVKNTCESFLFVDVLRKKEKQYRIDRAYQKIAIPWMKSGRTIRATQKSFCHPNGCTSRIDLRKLLQILHLESN